MAAQSSGDHSIQMQDAGNFGYGGDGRYGSAGPSGEGGPIRRTSTLASRQSRGENILEQLPSRQLASSAAGVMKRQTLRKKSKQQKVGYATLRLRHGVPVDTDDIVDNLLSDPEFALEPAELQTDDIRELATTLANKRSIRQKLQRSEDARKERRPGWFKRLGYAISLSWKRFKQNMAEATYSLELWRGQIKNIEGKFGTGVTSYFMLLKFLLLLNIPVFLLSFGLLVLPMILYRWLEQEPPGYIHNVEFTGVELLTGGGWFNETELYYGTYLNRTIEAIPKVRYDMKFAYLLVCAAYYILTLIILLYNLTKSYKENFINSSGAFSFYYVTKVFCGWDYQITNPKAAELKHNGLYKELQEYLSMFKKSDKNLTCGGWCGLWLFRICLNLIVIGLLAGSTYIVWYISYTQSLKTDLLILSELALPLCITAINFVLPYAFSMMAAFEKYENPRVELYLTMLRTITLNVVTLGCLIWFWFNEVDCSRREEYDREWFDSELDCRPCWENFMGEQIYRLVIVDFVFLLLLTFLSEFIRKIVATYCIKSLGLPEFNIGRNSLYLIYSQTLVWLGTYYSPLLSVIMILKVIIIFYVKWASVINNCTPSTKPWRAGRASTIILFLLSMAFLLSFISVCYSVGFIKPSEVCGPYQGFNKTTELITNLFDGWQEDAAWISSILEFITSTAFLISVAVALCAVLYYCKVIATGLEDMVALLKNQIAMEGKDKVFLLRLMQEAGARNRPKKGPVTAVNDWNRNATQMPSSPGGQRFFAKAKLAAASHSTPPSTPTSPGRPPLSPTSGQNSPSVRQRNQRQQGRGEHPSLPGRSDYPSRLTSSSADQPQENFNTGYLDKSMDRDSFGPRSSSNPLFTDRSPTTRPPLPFQAQHYDIYTSPTTDTPPGDMRDTVL